MKFVYFWGVLLLFFGVIISCDSMNNSNGNGGKTVYDLGEFEPLAGLIDLTQENQFPESALYGNWDCFSITREIYINGILDNTYDVTDCEFKIHISLMENHLVGNNAVWRYAYNCILIRNGGSFSLFEVANAQSGVLCLKKERFPVGKPCVPYAQDKSGQHEFTVYELHPE